MKFYDWRKVQTNINGVPVSGWAPGDDVYKAERLKEAVQYDVGADGHMTVSCNPDKSGKVTIKLAKTSPLNGYLSKISNLEDRVETFVPIILSQFDAYRQDFTNTTFGFIEKHADVAGGVKATDMEWTLIFPDITFDLGDPVFAGLPTENAELLG